MEESPGEGGGYKCLVKIYTPYCKTSGVRMGPPPPTYRQSAKCSKTPSNVTLTMTMPLTLTLDLPLIRKINTY